MHYGAPVCSHFRPSRQRRILALARTRARARTHTHTHNCLDEHSPGHGLAQLDGAGAKVAALAGMLRSAGSAPVARGAATAQEHRASALEKMLRLPLETKHQGRPLSAVQAQRSIALHPKNLRHAY